MIRSRGFTLIELLVVMAIIAALMALLVPILHRLRTDSRLYVSTQRIGAIQAAFSRLSHGGRSAAQELQRAGLGGAIAFRTDAAGVLQIAEGTWPTYEHPWQLRFPWGRPVLTWQAPGRPLFAPPRSLGLSQFHPQLTAELLAAAEVATVNEVLTNRNPAAAWNDAWGNPLVVAAALYQYGPDTPHSWPEGAGVEATAPSSAFTTQYAHAERFLSQHRLVYLSIGALGPKVPGPPPSEALMTPAAQAAAWTAWWSHIDSVCNRAADGRELWQVAVPDAGATAGEPSDPPDAINAQRTPPWQGVRRQRSAGSACLLAAPSELP